MKPLRGERAPHPTTAAPRCLRAVPLVGPLDRLLVLLLVLQAGGALLACARPAPLPDPEPAASGRGAPTALRVRLVFGAEADLDLYVTDPAQETVYFGNTPSRLGGALEADRRCDAPPPREETVVFDVPPPGPYRVGVDFPERCGSGVDRVPFRVHVEGPGVALRHKGEVAFGHFESRVLEFQLERNRIKGPARPADSDSGRPQREPRSRRGGPVHLAGSAIDDGWLGGSALARRAGPAGGRRGE